jgi:hypothetical protein
VSDKRLSSRFFSAHGDILPAVSNSMARINVLQIQQEANSRELSKADKWAALLHMNGQEPQLRGPDFLLSQPNFSAENELQATIAYLYGSDSMTAVCRFPARYAWLRSELATPALPLDQCEELQEFLSKAPAQKISLVFASENLSQPSSMMGHLFLAIAGQNSDGYPAEHAISFFTEVDTLNLPKLLYNSMITGKMGYFMLNPYHAEADYYLKKEQRTLWRYELNINKTDLQLIQYHMHELRHSQITYFFQNYNCATLVKHILAIAAPTLNQQQKFWSTPKDVLKMARDAGVISTVTVQTPSKWLIRSLQNALPGGISTSVKQQVLDLAVQSGEGEADEPDLPTAFMATELARAYNNYLQEDGQRSREVWLQHDKRIRQASKNPNSNLTLQADISKNPAIAPKDKQFYAGLTQQSGQEYMQLGLLPVSHTLADNNTQYFSENELRLFDVAALINRQTGHARLDHLTVYAAESLLPRDAFTGGLSGRFKLGKEQQASIAQEGKTAWLAEGAVGATWRIVKDIDLFALLGGGWGYQQHGYVYATPSAGVVVRELYDMKTMLTATRISRPLGERQASTELKLTQSKYLDANNTLLLEGRTLTQQTQRISRWSVTFKHLF